MWKLRINEWIIEITKSTYDNAHSKVRIVNRYGSSINASVGVHQGSVLSPLLFIIIVEALSREFRTGCPWELLYANDLVIVAESYGQLKVRLKNGKDGLEEKGVKVNVGKTKILCSRHDILKSKIASVKFPSGVCMKGVGANSIVCLSCRNWVHKRCSRIKATLRNRKDFVCKNCLTTAGADDPFPTCIATRKDNFKVASEFCYLVDPIGQASGSIDAISACIRLA